MGEACRLTSLPMGNCQQRDLVIITPTLTSERGRHLFKVIQKSLTPWLERSARYRTDTTTMNMLYIMGWVLLRRKEKRLRSYLLDSRKFSTAFPSS